MSTSHDRAGHRVCPSTAGSVTVVASRSRAGRARPCDRLIWALVKGVDRMVDGRRWRAV